MNNRESHAEQAVSSQPELDELIVEEERQGDVGLSADDADVDIVDWASDNSFPASDPPPWSPGTIS